MALRHISKIESTLSPKQRNIESFHEELIQGTLEFLNNEKRLELPQYASINFWERFKRPIGADDKVMDLLHADNDGFLFLTILDDAIKDNNKDRIEYLRDYYDSHTLSLPFEYSAQAVQAISSIRFYEQTKDIKYKKHADKMYQWLAQQDTQYGILYVKGLRVSLVDAIGVVVPFLMEYSETFDCPEAKELALRQIEIYTKYGCDKETGIPAFGYSVESPHIKTGSINWGRGLSWYVIALSYVNPEDLSFESRETINMLNQTLTEIWRRDHSFGHFVYDYIKEKDLSAELPIIWYLNKTGNIKLSKREILDYSQYMHNGIMYHCSNANSGAVAYGVAHGPLMLAQAFMLRLTKE